MKITPVIAAGLSLAMLPLAVEAAVTKKTTQSSTKSTTVKKTVQSKSTGKTASRRPALTSASIIRDMRMAAAYVTKYARQDMNPKSKMQRPFWNGLQLTTTSLTQMDANCKKRDVKFLGGLNSLGRGVSQVGTAWAVLRESYPKSKVGRGILALQKAQRTYMTHFGPQVARMKKGGAVSGKETAEVARQKAALGKFRGQLAGMKKKASKKGACPRMLADLDRQCALCMGMDAKGLNGYTKFGYTLGLLQDSLYAYYNSVGVWYPDQFSSWESCGSYYETFASASWRLDTVSYSSWDFTSESISHYGSYYQSSISDTSIKVSEELAYAEKYSSDAATAAVEADTESVAAEYETGADDADTLYDSVGEDDADGDGLANETDTDDDNDGTPDATDPDEDGDGLANADDAEPDGGEMELDAEDADEDGVADDVDMDDDNDGTSDTADTDDDGDGTADTEEEPEEEMADEEPADEAGDEPAEEEAGDEPAEEAGDEPAEEMEEEPAAEEDPGDAEPEPEAESEPEAEPEAEPEPEPEAEPEPEPEMEEPAAPEPEPEPEPAPEPEPEPEPEPSNGGGDDSGGGDAGGGCDSGCN